jgi:hypothetical protein
MVSAGPVVRNVAETEAGHTDKVMRDPGKVAVPR